MDRLALRDAMQLVLQVYHELSVVSKIAASILLAVLLHRAVSKPAKYKLFPVWATIEIAIASYVLSSEGLGRRVYSLVRRRDGSLFGLTPSHQLLVDFPGVDRLMSQAHTINAEPVQYTLFTRVFGGIDTPELKRKLEVSWKDLLTPIERLFLNDAAAIAAIERGQVAKKAAQLVSFSKEAKHMKRWELSANIALIQPRSPDGSHARAVEADLQSLTRDFGACFAIPLLYGQDFLDGSPHLLDDFWKFDNDLFPLLMIGLPTWLLLKMMKDGLVSQSRLLDTIEAFYHRIDDIQNGRSVGVDMSDVSHVPFDRNLVYEREGWSFKQRAGGDLAIFWGLNANTHPVLFWFLVYIYSTPGLLQSLREEVEPYIKLSPAKDEITAIEFSDLFRSCHLLKSCIFETYRMSVEATSIRYVEKSLTVADGDYTHELKPGMFISAPHGLTQHDPSLYPEPSKFKPDRFLERDASGSVTPRYGKLKPWGTGTSMCKGRSFAEKEIMALGTAVIALWDIAPASGAWEIPSMVPGTGVKGPVKDIRVRIMRRMA